MQRNWRGIRQYTVKPVLSRHSKKTQKKGLQAQKSLNAGQKVLQLLLPSLFCLFLSGRLRQGLLYIFNIRRVN